MQIIPFLQQYLTVTSESWDWKVYTEAGLKSQGRLTDILTDVVLVLRY